MQFLCSKFQICHLVVLISGAIYNIYIPASVLSLSLAHAETYMLHLVGLESTRYPERVRVGINKQQEFIKKNICPI